MAQLGLTTLTLSHFRSHRRMALDLRPGPIAIYGPNGAGKTNILEAVSILSPGRGMRRVAAEDMVRRPEGLGWKVSAILNAKSKVHEIETWLEGQNGRQVRIDGKAAPQVALGRIGRMLWLVPSMDRLWIEAAEGRRRFLDRMTLSFTPSHAECVLAYEKAMRERNRLLRDEVRDDHWYTALEGHMAREGAKMDANRRAALTLIAQAQDGAETAFPAADLQLLGPDGPATPWDESTLAAALTDSRARDLRAGRTLVGPHRADLGAIYAAKGTEARLCSTGEQKALLISLVLANARALAEDFGAPPIILLDEIAAHLDAARRAALYDEIVALGAQAWMTGTERILFDSLGDRAMYLEVSDDDGTSITQLS